MANLIIGLGTGRSGTLSLSRILNYHSEIEMHHENRAFMLEPQNHDFSNSMRILKNINDYLVRSSKKYFGDVCHNHIYRVPNYVCEFRDNVKFICVYRDPVSTVNSWMRKYNGLSACRFEDKDEIEKKFGDKYYRKWSNYFLKYYGTKSSKDAWYHYVNWYHKQMDSLGSLAFRLDIEDLNSDIKLIQMFKFLDLNPELLDKRIFNASK